jgi:Zn-dependent protease
VSADHTAHLESDFGLHASATALADAGAVTLFGIPVRFDLSCAFATALGTWTFADAILPAAAPGRSALAYWTGGAAAALLTMMSIVGHEVGHAIAARRAGIRVRRMVLSLFGGVTELVQTPWTPGIAFRIAIAGPVASTALGLVAAIAHVVLVEADANPLTSAIVALTAVANLAIAAINFLPGLPLDGGHVVAAALWRLTGRPLDAGRAAATLGRLLGLVMIAVAIIGSASGESGLALWLVLFGLTMWSGAEPPAYATRPARAPGAARATTPSRPARAA